MILLPLPSEHWDYRSSYLVFLIIHTYNNNNNNVCVIFSECFSILTLPLEKSPFWPLFMNVVSSLLSALVSHGFSWLFIFFKLSL